MLCLVRSIVQRATVSSLATKTRPFSITPRYLTATDVSTDEPVDITNPYEKEKKQCILCRHNIIPNYKNVELLAQFQSPYTGRIYGRHITGLCKTKQEQVEKAMIYAQNCAMMGFYNKDPDFLRDPKVCDPERTFRPHKY